MINLPVAELLAGLAEECGELVQATLKYRRALTQINPTPKSEEEAYDDMCEEIADVLLYLKKLPYNKSFVRDIMRVKEDRWEKRLEK